MSISNVEALSQLASTTLATYAALKPGLLLGFSLGIRRYA